MKIKFLGTAASEGIPALFCQCELCQEARRLKGKEIRTRNQVLVGDKLMIDFPPDTYWHTIKENFDISAVSSLLFTHGHNDHFYYEDLELRGSSYATKITEKNMNIYASSYMIEKIQSKTITMEDCVKKGYTFNIIDKFQTFVVDGYSITALPAQHTYEDSLMYLIQKDGSTFFFCCDTGVLLNEVIDYFVEKGIKIDCIAIDCTMGKFKQPRGGGHMGYENCLELKEELIEKGICSEKTKFVLTHFSHYGQILHKDYESFTKESNIIPAYDGMELEI